jgi:acyl dehydratase
MVPQSFIVSEGFRCRQRSRTNMTMLFIDELLSMAGTHLGYGHWREIRQRDVDQFADLIDEHQWIWRAHAYVPVRGS